ncbi:MAG: cytochrome c maturation protein CcmE [Hyphomonadaceae bacterium]|nr:cytochrome c maturation protein CcmE [Hyphomonadaceae bacterium]
MRARTQRLITVAIAAILVLAAAGLVTYAVRESANLFYTPERLAKVGLPEPGKTVKIGGLVEPGSLAYGENAEIRFSVIDGSEMTIHVSYTGIAPDLFQEGQGVVATGRFDTAGKFTATELLAKHDENYIPRELRHLEAPET